MCKRITNLPGLIQESAAAIKEEDSMQDLVKHFLRVSTACSRYSFLIVICPGEGRCGQRLRVRLVFSSSSALRSR